MDAVQAFFSCMSIAMTMLEHDLGLMKSGLMALFNIKSKMDEYILYEIPVICKSICF